MCGSILQYLTDKTMPCCTGDLLSGSSPGSIGHQTSGTVHTGPRSRCFPCLWSSALSPSSGVNAWPPAPHLAPHCRSYLCRLTATCCSWAVHTTTLPRRIRALHCHWGSNCMSSWSQHYGGGGWTLLCQCYFFNQMYWHAPIIDKNYCISWKRKKNWTYAYVCIMKSSPSSTYLF